MSERRQEFMNSLNIFSISPSKDPVGPSEASSSAKSTAPKKLDHRILMTRRLFRQALTELLRQKPLQSITVKELCQKAGVNRGTFYSHYTDIFALMEQIESEVSRELSDTLEDFTSRNPQSSPFSVYTSILQFFRRFQIYARFSSAVTETAAFWKSSFRPAGNPAHPFMGKCFPVLPRSNWKCFIPSSLLGA